jgi:hypothetical protein
MLCFLSGEHHGKPIGENGDYNLLFDADTVNMKIGIQGVECSDVVCCVRVSVCDIVFLVPSVAYV